MVPFGMTEPTFTLEQAIALMGATAALGGGVARALSVWSDRRKTRGQAQESEANARHTDAETDRYVIETMQRLAEEYAGAIRTNVDCEGRVTRMAAEFDAYRTDMAGRLLLLEGQLAECQRQHEDARIAITKLAAQQQALSLPAPGPQHINGTISGTLTQNGEE